MLKIEVNSFRERLSWILADRLISPWALANGLTKGLISRLNQGNLPRPAIVAQIAATENASADWLLNGIGAAYHVEREVTRDAFRDRVDQIDHELDHPQWFTIPLYADSTALMVGVGDQARDTDEPSFDSVRVVYGPALDCPDALVRSRVATVDVDETVAYAVAAGRIGGYRLVGSTDQPGPLPVHGEWQHGADNDGPAAANPIRAAFRRLVGEDPIAARQCLRELLLEQISAGPTDTASETPGEAE